MNNHPILTMLINFMMRRLITFLGDYAGCVPAEGKSAKPDMPCPHQLKICPPRTSFKFHEGEDE
ncbi:hypothetical protein CW705_08140 [Candidatus Bathyarchaeota archaeon]|nr:MAG: hypothetical protein CW705_08140 [Candidatus Bathyarchaeota archaeon]